MPVTSTFDITIWLWQIFLLGNAVTNGSEKNGNGSFNLNILVPGYIGFDSMASMSNVGPAVDSAVLHLLKIYPFLNITRTNLIQKTNSCDTMKFGVQDQLARWYYRNYRENYVDVIVTTGFTMKNVSGSNLNGVINLNLIIPGYIGFKSMASVSNVGPAVDTGVLLLQNLYPFLNITKTYLLEKTDDCDTMKFGVQNQLSKWYYRHYRESDVDVIITTACLEGAYINQLAAAWNILLITSKDRDDVLIDRRKSPTWITTTPLASPNDVYCKFLSNFNWTKVYLVHDLSALPYYQDAAERVAASLKNCNVQYMEDIVYSNRESFRPMETVRKFHENSRILLHFGNSSVLRRILISASILNMTQGEHVYVALLPFFNKFYGTFTWINNDPYDDIVRFAYQSVILMVSNQVSGMESPRLQELESEWKNRSLLYYNGTASHDLPRPFLTATYGAIEIIGKILNESRADIERFPKLFSSGSVLAEKILNRSFDLEVGQINITAHGERSPNFAVNFFRASSNQFEVFLESQLIEETLSWVKISEVSWFGKNTLPPNEPRCGYKGDRCLMFSSQNNGIYGLLGIILLIGLIAQTKAFMIRRDENRKIWWKIDSEKLVPLRDHIAAPHYLSRSFRY